MKRAIHSVIESAKRVFYGDRGEPYKVAGHSLRYIPGTRPVRLKYAKTGDWVSKYDALEIITLIKGVKAGDVMFDVGAHTGQYCIMMSALGGPTSTVVAFEPDPYARITLDKNLALNPHVKRPIVEPMGVSDSAGKLTLYSKGGNSNSSFAAGATGGSKDTQNEAFEVEIIDLDSYIASKSLLPTWIKIDTEGAEIRILQGASKLLQTDCNFLVELHPYAWPEFGNTFAELQAIVSASGRRMRYLDGETELTADPIYGVVVLER